ncbi:hypothetical protein T552_00665 [Pneumocystis carinii B80]|uniref:MSP domain-containing protein n=1 Tax=Pneumocystis carinii (strain B80) TaxID=1408658 RepID=A0A0W4ZP96_PNEC8|nr:hypothetical protein T552_00665 [Pneumocystis carinii B80]KTW30186.1 hypothetical protein T552_00665 [Pneumocystis carinii B80]
MTLKLSKHTLFFEELQDKISRTYISVKNPSPKHKVAFNLHTTAASNHYTIYPSAAMLNPNCECEISFEKHPSGQFREDNGLNKTIDSFIIQSIQIDDKMNKKITKMEKNDKIIWDFLESEVQKSFKKNKIKTTTLLVSINNKMKIDGSSKLTTEKLNEVKEANYNSITRKINHFSTMPIKFFRNNMFMQNQKESEYFHQKKGFHSSETLEIMSSSRRYQMEENDSKSQELFKDSCNMTNKHESPFQSLKNDFFHSTDTFSTHMSDNTTITVVNLGHSHKTYNNETNGTSLSELWSNKDSDNDINLNDLKRSTDIIDSKKIEKDFHKGIEHLQVWKLIQKQGKTKHPDTFSYKDEFSDDEFIIPSLPLKQNFIASAIPIDSGSSLLSLSQKSTESFLSQEIFYTYKSSTCKETKKDVRKISFNKESLFSYSQKSTYDNSVTPDWMYGILNLQKDFQAMIEDFDQKTNFDIKNFNLSTISCQV